MADAAMTIEADAGNVFRTINRLALEVQESAREAAHLIAAIDDASETFSFGGEPIEARHLEAMDRIVIFCRLARQSAKRAMDLGEDIERAAKMPSVA